MNGINNEYKILYAKSDPLETIVEHTEKLINNVNILKNTYGDKLVKDNSFIDERFWKLLEIVCTYHDIGKVFTPFQNLILTKIGLENIPTKFSYEIKHEQISPMFLPELRLSPQEKLMVNKVIYYHHNRKKDNTERSKIDDIIKYDITPKIENIKSQIPYDISKNIDSSYLGYKNLKLNEQNLGKYIMLKGLLYRMDYSSSAGIPVEDNTKEEIGKYTERYIVNSLNNKLNKLQKFCKSNVNENLLIVGSTGIGKTEAAGIWSNNCKTFFTLPIRISINAIYDRIEDMIGYKHVGLLHSSALEYLEERNVDENSMKLSITNYEEARNLSSKLTICTIDQIFPFVFRYTGYEKMYATLAYSKIIIDEIQAYDADIVAIIIKGIEMLYNMGGRFMIMTATLPKIYKNELERRNIKFNYGEFLKNINRHKISINKCMDEDYKNIIQKGKNNKVLIIANTVDKSIEIYNTLQRLNNGVDIKLLHSRFIQIDRTNKEKEIIDFSKNKSQTGIRITTQIVEASLDVDFDYLFTEMSTLDSLFQRMGRCYRNREYTKEEPNIYIYTKDISGKKYVYDEEIWNKSLEILKREDNKILTENVKVNMVDELYSEENLKETLFYKKFKKGIKTLDEIVELNDIDKNEAIEMIRKIDNVTVVPQCVYEKNIKIFEEYKNTKKIEELKKLKKQINKFTVSINKYKCNQLREYVYDCCYVDNLKIINTKYDEFVGLELKENKVYNIESRFL